jgi:hypothetical protein
MKVIGAIRSLEEFNDIVEQIRWRRAPLSLGGYPYRHEFYRGQADAGWSVIPGIGRRIGSVDTLRAADAAVSAHFRRRMTEMGLKRRVHLWEHPRGFQDDWSWYIQAQHYRVPTRLLDWTGKPEVALFFAVEEARYDGVDGAFYVYHNPQSAIKIEGGDGPEFFEERPSEMAGTWFLNPAFDAHADNDEVIAEGRRLRQFGKFTLQDYTLCLRGLDKQANLLRSYEETVDLDVPVMEKWLIPAEFKPQLRLDMVAAGWYGEYLYLGEDPLVNEIQTECAALLAGFEN